MRASIGFLALCAAFGSASSIAAAEATYRFSGTISSLATPENTPEWQFATGQRFTGTLVYDPDRIESSFDFIDTPGWRLTAYRSPLVSLRYSVELPSGRYDYDVPTQALTGSANQLVAVGRGTDGWNGIDVRTQNYPIGWTSNPPSMPVPPSAYVGALNPHSAFLSMNVFGVTGIVPADGADIDLVQLYAITGGFFSVRFSDSYLWETGVERIDGVFGGNLDSFERVVTGVPEASTWAMFILGFGLAGMTMRRRRAPAPAVAR